MTPLRNRSEIVSVERERGSRLQHDPSPLDGVRKDELPRVEEEALASRAVDPVARDRRPFVREMETDLVRPPGEEREDEQRPCVRNAHHAEARPRRSAKRRVDAGL